VPTLWLGRNAGLPSDHIIETDIEGEISLYDPSTAGDGVEQDGQ
jgi:hypothetical protein